MRKLIIVSFLIVSFLNLFAQENELGKKVRIVSKYKTVLSKANKLDYKPVIKDSVVQQVSFDYYLKAKKVKSFYNLVENEYPKYSIKSKEDFGNNYIRLAAGNNMRFLGEYAYSNDFDEKYNFGFYLKSNSSAGTVRHNKKSRDIGLVDQTALVYISQLENDKSYGLSMSYNRYIQHYYGGVEYVNANKETKGTFSTNVFYKNILSSEIKYGVNIDYTNFADKYSDAFENMIKTDANVNIDLGNSELVLGLEIDYLNSRYDNDFASASLEPHFKTSFGRLKLDFGFGISQYVGDNAGFYFYPKSNLYLDILGRELGLYVKIDGGVENNNFLNSWKTNPFVVVTKSKQSYTRYDISGGLKGRYDNLFWYDFGVSYSNINDFRSYKIEDSHFVQYYSDEKIFVFDAEFGINIDEDLSVLSKFTNYSFNDEAPSNIPNCEILFNAKYKFSKQISFGSDLYVVGTRNTSIAIGGTDKFETKGIIYDFRLNADYEFSKYINAFISVNNIFNQHYERWEEYPVTGINLLAGFTICF